MAKEKERLTEEDFSLLDGLGVDITPEKKETYTKLEERVIAGFEEVERFVEEHGRLPRHGEDRDIFERLYAVRLGRIWDSETWRTLLAPFDSRNLTVPPPEFQDSAATAELSDVDLLAAIGASPKPGGLSDLRYVRSTEEIRAAEEIAKRETCEDFEVFRPLFEEVKRDLKLDIRKTLPWDADKTVSTGDFFIIGGQVAYVAAIGEEFKQEYGDLDARLRVIYDNGTEADLLRRSLQRALLKDETSRRIRLPTAGPLFADTVAEEDLPSGHIYVLRSQSTHPFIAKHRDLVHKIGVTGGDIKRRVANAAKDPTYLFAEVEIVAEYRLANVNRHRLETLIQRFFAEARLDLELPDRFGKLYQPQEWFLVPLPAIREMIGGIVDGTVTDYRYDPKTASLLPI